MSLPAIFVLASSQAAALVDKNGGDHIDDNESSTEAGAEHRMTSLRILWMGILASMSRNQSAMHPEEEIALQLKTERTPLLGSRTLDQRKASIESLELCLESQEQMLAAATTKQNPCCRCCGARNNHHSFWVHPAVLSFLILSVIFLGILVAWKMDLLDEI